VDSNKVQDALSWNAHMSVGDIRSFLGLAGYYQRTELLEKDKKFEWMAACEASF
jgi:hypothetical protein